MNDAMERLMEGTRTGDYTGGGMYELHPPHPLHSQHDYLSLGYYQLTPQLWLRYQWSKLI